MNATVRDRRAAETTRTDEFVAGRKRRYGLRVTATKPDATDATPVARLRLDVFDANTERLGAVTDAARAELLGVDRATIWRWRNGRLTPSLDRAMAIAEVLGIELGDLIDRSAA